MIEMEVLLILLTLDSLLCRLDSSSSLLFSSIFSIRSSFDGIPHMIVCLNFGKLYSFFFCFLSLLIFSFIYNRVSSSTWKVVSLNSFLRFSSSFSSCLCLVTILINSDLLYFSRSMGSLSYPICMMLPMLSETAL